MIPRKMLLDIIQQKGALLECMVGKRIGVVDAFHQALALRLRVGILERLPEQCDHLWKAHARINSIGWDDLFTAEMRD